MARAQAVERAPPWTISRVDHDDRERMLDHVEALETTRVTYALPLIIGMMAGVVAAVGLLLASL